MVAHLELAAAESRGAVPAEGAFENCPREVESHDRQYKSYTNLLGMERGIRRETLDLGEEPSPMAVRVHHRIASLGVGT